MKLIKTFFILVAASMLITSCGTDLGDLIDDGGGLLENSNIKGTWNIDSFTQNLYIDGVLDENEVVTDMGTLTFTSDGSGTYTIDEEGETASGSFEWFEKNDKFFMNFLSLSEDVITDNIAIGWDVVTNTASAQKWTAEISQYVDEENYDTGEMIRQLQKTELIFELSKN